MGRTNKDIGKANNILAIFEPTMFPIAIPEWSFSAALRDIASSGADVPKETIVTATIKVGTFNIPDREMEPFTKRSPVKNKVIIPSKKKTTSINAYPVTFVLYSQ